MREIEIKLRVPDLEALKIKLIEKGCVLSDPISQHDTIYSKKDSIKEEWTKPKEGDIVLRIRRQDGIAEFNIKQQRSHELDNIEYETEVKDPKIMHEMLVLMGFAQVVEVRKLRQKGKWGEYEICLDTVDELGTFVELEKLADDDANVEQIEEQLFQTLESFGLSRSDQEKLGYDSQIYKLRNAIKSS